MIQLLVINDDTLTTGTGMHCGADFEVSVADSPLAAFNSIIHINPDAIVLRTGNGFDHVQVLRRIRNMQASKNTPLLVLSKDEPVVTLGNKTADKNTEYKLEPCEWETICRWVTEKLDVSDEAGQKEILVVDDDPVILDLTRLYLGAKYKVTTMNRSYDVLDRLENYKPDLILLDIAMPEIDGKELFKMIKEIPGCEEIPILFQTGMAGINTVRECVKLGAAGFVIKPLQKPVLLERVEEVLGTESKKKVYVFEEKDFIFQLINGFLKDNYEVLRGDSVLSSNNRLEEVNPDVLMIDIDSSAFILNHVRSTVNQLSIPLVLLTKDLESDIVKKERLSPNTAIVQMPLNKEPVREAVMIMAQKKAAGIR
ncbi:MAG: response regulator [Lachnospiraceae bacterium]|nr:response regulator [Lachnospiraceae bacterium]